MCEMPQPDALASPQAGAGRLVAVVVTHNRCAHLARALASLLAAPACELAAVIVVDNASTDGTGAWLKGQTDPRLDVLSLPENRGGAGGFEAGMRRAMAAHAPDWIVVLDDDACPEPGTVAAFHALDLSGWDAIAAAVYLPDGTPCQMNRPTMNPFARPGVLLRALAGGGREAFHLGPAAYAGTAILPVDGASFVGLFLSAATVAAAGYPESRLFLYAEDAMYTLGLTRSGRRIGFAPMLRFRHDCTTFSPGDGRIQPVWKVYYYYRNLTLLYRQVAGAWLFWPVMALYAPLWLARLRHYRGARRRYLRLLGLALRDGVLGRRHRPHIQILGLEGDAG